VIHGLAVINKNTSDFVAHAAIKRDATGRINSPAE